MRHFVFALLAASCLASPAMAAITIANVTTAITSSAVTTLTSANSTSDCPVNSYVIVVGSWPASSAWSFSDTAGNTYSTPTNFVWNTNEHLIMSIAKVTIDLPINSTISVTWTTSGRPAFAAICATGLLATTPLDVTGTGGQGTTSPISGVSVTPGQVNELVVAAWGNSAGTYGTWTEDTNFTSGNFPIASSNNNVRIATCITACTGTGSISYAPQFNGTAHPWAGQLFTYKPAGGASPTQSNLLTLGVGK